MQCGSQMPQADVITPQPTLRHRDNCIANQLHQVGSVSLDVWVDVCWVYITVVILTVKLIP